MRRRLCLSGAYCGSVVPRCYTGMPWMRMGCLFRFWFCLARPGDRVRPEVHSQPLLVFVSCLESSGADIQVVVSHVSRPECRDMELTGTLRRLRPSAAHQVEPRGFPALN